MQFTAAVENVPVLIVGGGGAGLTASMLLACQGLEHLLVSARATTSDLPKAHVLNQWAMEVLDDVGAAEAIAQRSTPAEQLEQDEDGVRALIRENASGREYVVKNDYLLGADGGRRVAGLIGVEHEGLGIVTQTATLHVSADFSRWAKDPDVLIRWIYSPQAGVLAVLVPMGPERWGPDSEEWVIHLHYPVDCAETDAKVEADARKAQLPALACRSTVLRGMRAQSMEFSELNVEYGYSYQSAAIVPDDTAAPVPLDDIRVYQPSTRPGAPLPHAWIDDDDGNRRPIKDLVAPGRFLLIAGEDGEAWREAAQALAADAGIPLDAVRIGHLDGDVYDPRCAWLCQRA